MYIMYILKYTILIKGVYVCNVRIYVLTEQYESP